MKRFTFITLVVFLCVYQFNYTKAQYPIRPRPVVDTTCKGYLTLVTGDSHVPLRGAAMSIFTETGWEPTDILEAKTETNWAKNMYSWMQYHEAMHFNAMRLVDFDSKQRGDDWGSQSPPDATWTLTEKIAIIDSCVKAAKLSGMYIVINYHDHPEQFDDETFAEFDEVRWEWMKDFWRVVAPRYKDEEHVIYELTNEVATEAGDWNDDVFKAQMKEIYELVKDSASETPLILFTFKEPGIQKATDVLKMYIDNIFPNWRKNKDVIGWHAYDSPDSADWYCDGYPPCKESFTEVNSFLDYCKSMGYGVIVTESGQGISDMGEAGTNDKYNWDVKEMLKDYHGYLIEQGAFEEKWNISWFDWKSGKSYEDFVKYGTQRMKKIALDSNFWWSRDLYVNIEATATSIKIDGLDEGGYVSTLNSIDHKLQEQTPEQGDLFAGWRATWDQENLYLHVLVGDSELKEPDSGDQYWEDDGVEVYLSLADIRSHNYTNPKDFQFYFRRNDSILYEVHSHAKLDQVHAVFLDTDVGYNLEVKFPWSSLNMESMPDSGKFIGIDVHINDDDDNDPERDNKISWYTYQDDVWQCPQFMGTARLSGNPIIPPEQDSVIYLSDLIPISETASFKPCQIDNSIDGNPITLNGEIYDKGLGCHATSELVYYLGGAYHSFLVDIGIDDEMKDPKCGEVEYMVYADGELRFTSESLTPISESVSLNIDVSGVDELRLNINALGSDYCDHGNWANARLLTGEYIPVTSIDLLPDSVVLNIGDSIQMNTVIKPANASQQSVSYRSFDLDESVITLNQEGKIVAVGPGEAGIVVRTKDNGIEDTSHIEVLPGESEFVYLSDLIPEIENASFRPCEKDLSIDENPLILEGITYAKGLGCHAESELVYDLNNQYTRFTAKVGIDDEINDPSCGGMVEFFVYLDSDRILSFQSGPMTIESPTKDINIDILGRDKLILKIVTLGPNWCDHGDWADAKLFKSNELFAPSIQGAFPNTLGTFGSWNVYPNPTNQTELFIEQPEAMEVDYVLTSLNGSEIAQGQIFEKLNTIKLPQVVPGMYLLTIRHKEEVVTQKIVIH